MKLAKLFGLGLALAMTGCVSHRQPVAYTTTTTTLTPTSDRPVVRVYPDATSVRVEPPITAPVTTVSSGDMAIADSIRRMLENDSALASAARGVHFTVDNGRVSLTGSVLTESERWQIHNDLSRLPG